MADKVEIWENVSESKVMVNSFDEHNKKKQELVRPGQRVHVTTSERKMLNQDTTLLAVHDVFQNGFLSPVSLADDASELVENDNHMTATEMKELFSIRNAPKFKKAVSGITSEISLGRLYDIASSGDEDVDATSNQVKIVREALAEVSTSTIGVEVESSSPQSPADQFASRPL
jgi:hypothetical protein